MPPGVLVARPADLCRSTGDGAAVERGAWSVERKQPPASRLFRHATVAQAVLPVLFARVQGRSQKNRQDCLRYDFLPLVLPAPEPCVTD